MSRFARDRPSAPHFGAPRTEIIPDRPLDRSWRSPEFAGMRITKPARPTPNHGQDALTVPVVGATAFAERCRLDGRGFFSLPRLRIITTLCRVSTRIAAAYSP